MPFCHVCFRAPIHLLPHSPCKGAPMHALQNISLRSGNLPFAATAGSSAAKAAASPSRTPRGDSSGAPLRFSPCLLASSYTNPSQRVTSFIEKSSALVCARKVHATSFPNHAKAAQELCTRIFPTTVASDSGTALHMFRNPESASPARPGASRAGPRTDSR